MPKLEKLERVSTFERLAMTQPMRIPGLWSPLVQAPSRNTLLLSRSLTQRIPLTPLDGWNIS